MAWNCLRCRSTKNSKILDENWTVLPPATADDCHIECDGRFATITNGAMKATIRCRTDMVWRNNNLL